MTNKFLRFVETTALVLSFALFMMPIPSASQEVGAQAAAKAGAKAGAASKSAALSGSSLTQNNTYNTPDRTQQTITQDGGYDIRNVPAVSAPAIFGGGHPCLSGSSAGGAISGFGITGGISKAETVCMLYYMNQPEAAIRALVMTDKVACKALNNVGYYRVGNQVIPFSCGDTKPGGAETAGINKRTATTATSTKSPKPLFTKCARRSDGKISIKYTSLGKKNVEAAQQRCLTTLK